MPEFLAGFWNDKRFLAHVPWPMVGYVLRRLSSLWSWFFAAGVRRSRSEADDARNGAWSNVGNNSRLSGDYGQGFPGELEELLSPDLGLENSRGREQRSSLCIVSARDKNVRWEMRVLMQSQAPSPWAEEGGELLYI